MTARYAIQRSNAMFMFDHTHEVCVAQIVMAAAKNTNYRFILIEAQGSERSKKQAVGNRSAWGQ